MLCRLWRPLGTPFLRLIPLHPSPHRPPTSGLICPTIGVFKNTFLVLDFFLLFCFFVFVVVAIFPLTASSPHPPLFLVSFLVFPPPPHLLFLAWPHHPSPPTPPISCDTCRCIGKHAFLNFTYADIHSQDFFGESVVVVVVVLCVCVFSFFFSFFFFFFFFFGGGG